MIDDGPAPLARVTSEHHCPACLQAGHAVVAAEVVDRITVGGPARHWTRCACCDRAPSAVMLTAHETTDTTYVLEVYR